MLYHYVTIPAMDKQLAQMLGLTADEGRKRLKRSADSTSDKCGRTPVKQRKVDGFSVKLDVQHFQPEDLTIKVVANDLLVIGKHGERLDDNGWVSRQFTRRYQLPEDIDSERMTSKLTNDGQLYIEAPLKQKTSDDERVIPITVVRQKTTQIEKSDESSDPKTGTAVDGA